MHGNVWEWCEDWYDDSYYSSAEATKPNPVNTKEATYRVLRGGSWGYDAQNCRSANRNYYTPTYRSANVGFRVVSF
jgi:formylglycine-generating enzyme required for sulfatase activity